MTESQGQLPLIRGLAIFALLMGLGQLPAPLLAWQRHEMLGSLNLSLPWWALALPAAIMALFWLAVSVGLWKRWPRVRLLALWGLPLLLMARFAWFAVMAQNAASRAALPGRMVLAAALCLLWTFILTRPRVRAAFHVNREGNAE